jgi:tetratricopeptide (TPR) repeat protein
LDLLGPFPHGLDRLDEAVALIREAVDLYRKIEQPYDLALCLEALADVLVRRGTEDDQILAKEALQEAVGIYQQLGAEFEVRRMQQASGGGRAPGAGQGPP